MTDLPNSSVKYIIKATIKSKGVVEKPDVIGAIFGQTEGLLGPDMDLRKLQVKGKVGRIEVDVEKNGGNSIAKLEIPSGLDSAETSILAASLETIDRVGPCIADVEVTSVEDIRVSKRNYIVDRAQELLEDMVDEAPGPDDLSKSVRKRMDPKVKTYYGLYAGPGVFESDELILVEGRSDVLNLLNNGYDNVVALGGTSVPEKISEVVSGHDEVILFLDGDRGGDLIRKEMDEKAEYDFICRAPDGKEVEDLDSDEIMKCLDSRKENVKKISEEDEEIEKLELEDKERVVFGSVLDELLGTRAAVFLNDNLEEIGKIPVSKMKEGLESFGSEAYAVVFDGSITDKKARNAKSFGVDYLVGMRGSVSCSGVNCLTREDI